MSLNVSAPVLVVDDAGMMIQIVTSMLERIGFHEIDSANSGHEALAMLWRKDYGLVIADWNMSPITGFELLSRMRKQPAFSNVPFIMITANPKEARVVAARDAGAAAFLAKPFSLESLELKIIETLALQ